MNVEDELRALSRVLPVCMLSDRRSFAQRLKNFQRAGRSRPSSRETLDRLIRDVNRSKRRYEERAQHLPAPSFSQKLPILRHREEISRALTAHQVVVVCGETGSGKTTQLPQICLSLGRGVGGTIGHTQPRRIVARSVASRIAQELGEEVGQSVGYKVRFQDRLGPKTHIKLMTDGILLAETQSDRLLEAYDTLIIDEAHERSLNIDFLLGYLTRILAVRPDLKLIITSATIDPTRFSRHFGDAPIIEVSGRMYPVEIRYRPLSGDDEDRRDLNMQEAILETVQELGRGPVPGDILVFLSGEREIRETTATLRKFRPYETETLPLYARLSAAEQDRVFLGHDKRRIILATNVAETSLTVPGIRFVIDTGYARISRYSYRAKVQRLPIEKISRAAADQRKGRCGRVSDGVCVRLYPENDYLLRREFTEPEIRRTNLAAVILQMKALGLGDVESFPFIDAPDKRLIHDGFRLLTELGAVDESLELTPMGRQLARLPVDPRIGRMLLGAKEEGSLTEVLVIASALSVQDPRERPFDRRRAADEQHARFQNRDSDFLSLFHLWQFFEEQRRHLSQSKLRKLCQEYFVSYRRMREWRDIHQELYTLVRQLGFETNPSPASYKQVHKAILAGLLGNIATRRVGSEYEGAHGVTVFLFPGSGLFKRRPQWIMAAEFLETSRLYAHTVAKIEPAWIENVAGALILRDYVEPHWDPQEGQVRAYEKCNLYGLVVHPGRKVHYGPLQPAESRRILIRSGLVEEGYHTKAPFWRHNRQLVAEIRQLEEKSRRRDVLVGDEQLFAFYDERIPQGIYSRRRLEMWLKNQANQQRLVLNRATLMRHAAENVTHDQFPDVLFMNDMSFQLQYHFEPGHPADGVTLIVPLATLNQLDAARCDWLVPGLVLEKTEALIRSLPRLLRRQFVPVSRYAEEFVLANEPAERSLTEALAAYLRGINGSRITARDFRLENLPAHLFMHYRVVNPAGQEIASGRDLNALRESLGITARETFKQASPHALEREGITRWDFGDLPETVAIERDGLSLTGYPALEDCSSSVALRLLDSPEMARHMTRQGVRRLFMLELAQLINYLRKNLPGIDEMCKDYLSVGSCEELREDLMLAITTSAFLGTAPPVRTARAFHDRKERARDELMTAANELCRLVAAILREYRSVLQTVEKVKPFLKAEIAADVHCQLDHLVNSSFVSRTPRSALEHFPRYLTALRVRLEKLRHEPGRDARRAAEVIPLWQGYLAREKLHAEQGIVDPALEKYRWMLEEWRVSLFAQELKTASPISSKRLSKQWEQVLSLG